MTFGTVLTELQHAWIHSREDILLDSGSKVTVTLGLSKLFNQTVFPQILSNTHSLHKSRRSIIHTTPLTIHIIITYTISIHAIIAHNIITYTIFTHTLKVKVADTRVAFVVVCKSADESL